MEILLIELGYVKTEIFIKMLSSVSLDNTKWQRVLWEDKSIEEISTKATQATKQ